MILRTIWLLAILLLTVVYESYGQNKYMEAENLKLPFKIDKSLSLQLNDCPDSFTQLTDYDVSKWHVHQQSSHRAIKILDTNATKTYLLGKVSQRFNNVVFLIALVTKDKMVEYMYITFDSTYSHYNYRMISISQSVLSGNDRHAGLYSDAAAVIYDDFLTIVFNPLGGMKSGRAEYIWTDFKMKYADHFDFYRPDRYSLASESDGFTPDDIDSLEIDLSVRIKEYIRSQFHIESSNFCLVNEITILDSAFYSLHKIGYTPVFGYPASKVTTVLKALAHNRVDTTFPPGILKTFKVEDNKYLVIGLIHFKFEAKWQGWEINYILYDSNNYAHSYGNISRFLTDGKGDIQRAFGKIVIDNKVIKIYPSDAPNGIKKFNLP